MTTTQYSNHHILDLAQFPAELNWHERLRVSEVPADGVPTDGNQESELLTRVAHERLIDPAKDRWATVSTVTGNGSVTLTSANMPEVIQDGGKVVVARDASGAFDLRG